MVQEAKKRYLRASEDLRRFRARIERAGLHKALDDWSFAKLLYEVRETYYVDGGVEIPVYQALDYSGWGEFFERCIGVHFRQAQRLICVYAKFGVELKGLWSKDQLLPVCKMRELTPVVTASNVQSWLRFARKATHGELRVKVGQELGDQLNEQDRATTRAYYRYNIHVTKEEANLIDRALIQARGDSTDTRKGALFAMLARTFLSDRKRRAA